MLEPHPDWETFMTVRRCAYVLSSPSTHAMPAHKNIRKTFFSRPAPAPAGPAREPRPDRTAGHGDARRPDATPRRPTPRRSLQSTVFGLYDSRAGAAVCSVQGPPTPTGPDGLPCGHAKGPDPERSVARRLARRGPRPACLCLCLCGLRAGHPSQLRLTRHPSATAL